MQCIKGLSSWMLRVSPVWRIWRPRVESILTARTFRDYGILTFIFVTSAAWISDFQLRSNRSYTARTSQCKSLVAKGIVTSLVDLISRLLVNYWTHCHRIRKQTCSRLSESGLLPLPIAPNGWMAEVWGLDGMGRLHRTNQRSATVRVGLGTWVRSAAVTRPSWDSKFLVFGIRDTGGILIEGDVMNF